MCIVYISMAEKKFTVLDLLELDLQDHDALELKCIAGRRGLPKELIVSDINRPGLALSGFFDSFAYQRVQLFGRGEVAYLNKLKSENRIDTIKQFFEYDIPCCVFSHDRTPPEVKEIIKKDLDEANKIMEEYLKFDDKERNISTLMNFQRINILYFGGKLEIRDLLNRVLNVGLAEA